MEENLEEDKDRLNEEIKKIASDHEELKQKSLLLIKKINKAEGDNNALRSEKTQLVESILLL